MGLALRQDDDHLTPWLARADKALYLAKHLGRNQVQTYIKNANGEANFTFADLLN